MKNVWIIRALVTTALAILIGWLAYSTRWVEVEVDDDAHGLAATDERYSLRQVLQSTGATLEVRTALEPLPPANATLLLESSLWNIFPERDARLQAWVANGGRLVVAGQQMHDGDLRWIPLSFYTPPKRHAASGVPPSEKVAPAPDTAASAAEERDDEDDDVPATRKKPPIADNGKTLARLFDPKHPWRDCSDFEETSTTTEPAFEPDRVYRGCTVVGALRPAREAVPTWQLTGMRGTLAIRIPLGRGSVTDVSVAPVLDNRGLLQGDNALIAMAILQAAPGRAVWIVEDEAREPLLGWLWHDARTPFLLGLAAIALALWRLMVRFGPREAVPPQARRSMGEQVRGTGQFIAGLAPEVLHAVTKKAFEEVARQRVEAWSELTDPDRARALADALAPHITLDTAALLSSLNIGGGATPVQILAAIAVLEQTRRTLLRAPATPITS
jgi:hypothetical protein